jgi:tetratricopeptide (TPR) repeat protein
MTGECARDALEEMEQLIQSLSFDDIVTIDATSVEHVKASLAKLGEEAGLEATEKAGLHVLKQLYEPSLLIIDNADDPDLKISDLIPKKNHCCVIITTRNLSLCQIPTARSLKLQGLKPDESRQLLLACAGISESTDDATVALGNELCELLGHLTLALVVAGRYIHNNFYHAQLQDYLEAYKSKRGTYRSDVMEKGIVYPAFETSFAYLRKQDSQSCRDAIEILNIIGFYDRHRISLDIFTRAAQNRHLPTQGSTSIVMRMLQSLPNRLHPPPVLPDFLKGVAPEKEVYRAREGLSELASLSLISVDSTTTEFSLHPLVHSWARDRLSKGEQKIWARIAFNVLAETIELPSQGDTPSHGHGGEKHNNERFHRSLLPHLDSCLPLCSIEMANYEDLLPRAELYLSPYLLPTFLYILKERTASVAKLGYVYGECGRFEESLQYLEQVKRLLYRSLGPSNPRTMALMLGLAKIHWGLGQLDDAISLQKEVVSARERMLGPSNEETLVAMDELGRSYWLNGQYVEALKQAEKTKTLMELILGPEDRRTLVALDRYGVALQSWHRFGDSARIHEDVLKLREKKLGPKHLETLESKNNLAMALMNLKQFDEAEDLMAEVYRERSAQLGKEHPWTRWALCYLAKIMIKTQQLKEAEDFLQGGIEAAERSLPKDHLGILMGEGELARVYSRQGRLDEAVAKLSTTVERLEKTRGTDHPDSFYARWKLSVLYQQQGRLDEAVKACQIALDRAKERLTKAHPLVSMIEADLEQFEKALHPQGQQNHDNPALNGEASGPKRRSGLRTQVTW